MSSPDVSSHLMLLAAKPSDIPTLALLHAAAGEVDVATRLIFPNHHLFVETIATMLQGQINSPEWLVMKAIDGESNEIMGFGAWKLCHYKDIEEKSEQHVEEPCRAKSGAASDGAEDVQNKAEFNPPPGLGVYLQTHSRKVVRTSMGDTRYMLLNTLMTEPRYQGRGVGTALVRWGNARADADNVSSFLQGSAFAYKLYLKHGWKIVEQFDVDLREWLPHGKRDDMGYGNYSYRYMIRLPKPQD